MSDNYYEKLLDEKFNSIHQKIDLQFENVNKTLNSIEAQTMKTNGRVLKLEDQVKDLNIRDITHKVNCPQNGKFEHMEQSIENLKNDFDDKLKDVNFFVRNPKLGVGIIVVAVLLTIFSYVQIKNFLILHTAEKNNIELLK